MGHLRRSGVLPQFLEDFVIPNSHRELHGFRIQHRAAGGALGKGRKAKRDKSARITLSSQQSRLDFLNRPMYEALNSRRVGDSCKPQSPSPHVLSGFFSCNDLPVVISQILTIKEGDRTELFRNG